MKLVPLALAPLVALALSACGSSDSAKEEAQADNVEMPAEEAVGDLDAAATPAADAGASAGAVTGPPADGATAAANEGAAASEASGQ